MLDDIMDGSTTRRGVPCWYQLPDVGLSAVNDSSLMFSSIFYVLRAHFPDEKLYVNLVDLFNEVKLVVFSVSKISFELILL